MYCKCQKKYKNYQKLSHYLNIEKKAVGELEGIDFDAFFNPDSFTHDEIQVKTFVESKYNRTMKMRDQNLTFPPKKCMKIHN